jgi:predicted acyltransferase
LASIDALRGFDMFWIIGGGTIFAGLYDVLPHPATQWIRRQLEHVQWEGFHFYDLIFPLFLFIVGLVLPFSVSRRLRTGQGSRKLFWHIVRRSAVLILLGFIYNGFLSFDFADTRWAGVLQRIGLCYFFAAVLTLYSGWRIQALAAAAILFLYWLLLAAVPVPGYGAGVITPQGCLASYVDRLLLPGVLYYGCGDNEGLLSTLPAVATTLLGVLAGHWLHSEARHGRKVLGLAFAGVVCVVVGYLWGLSFPIVKIIWTSSYVLYAGGWSLLLLALFYWLVDVKGFKRWAFFFVVIGANPITIYFLQAVVDFPAVAKFFVQGAITHSGSLQPMLLPLSVLAVKWLFLWFLYRRGIFLKI